MPLYDYKCPICKFEEINRKEHPDNTEIKCPSCPDGVMRRQLHAQFGINMGPVPTGGYYDENLEAFVGTNAERKRLMREKGVTEHGATPKDGEAWV